MKPLRLLAIIEASNITGPAKNLIEFASMARGEGVETTVATFVRGDAANLFIETALKKGIEIEAIPERGLGDPKLPRALRDLFERVRPDIVQTHAVKSHFLARLAGLPERAPWIAFHHGYTWPAFRARVYNQLDRWSLRKARKVLTVSGPYRDELVGKGVAAERIEIVHNAIACGWGRREGAAPLVVAEDRAIVLSVGRLSREKDHVTLLRAVDRLRRGMPVHAVIVGEGPERPRVEQEIARLGLKEHVTLTGQQDSAEPYYGMADVAVLPSVIEGSSNALLEAMAAGVPIVATAVGGTPEIVTHGESALLVRPGDAQEMAAAIERILADKALAQYLIEKSRALIRERHVPEQRTRRLVGIYREVSGMRSER